MIKSEKKKQLLTDKMLKMLEQHGGLTCLCACLARRGQVKMKLTVIRLWALACAAYGVSVFMASEGRIVGPVLFSAVCLMLLFCTRIGDEPRRS